MGSRVVSACALGAVLLVSSAGCSPCQQTTVGAPDEICLGADAGAPQPDAAFVLTASNYYQGAPGDCVVEVDGGVISITVTATGCAGGNANPGNPLIRASSTTCQIPPLPAGSYAIGGRSPWTLTLPGSAQARRCGQ